MERLTQFDFYGTYRVELQGTGELAEKLKQTYHHFITTDQSDDPDLIIDLRADIPDPEIVLGDPDRYYGRNGTHFIIKQWGNHLAIDETWKQIRATDGTSQFPVSYLLEFEVRKHLATQGRMLLHASGANINGRTFVFPAWRHAGKTNTMLSFLRAGGDYLSDDRVWVDAGGQVWGYPLPINMRAPNIQSFAEQSGLTRPQQLRRTLSEAVFDNVTRERSFIDKVIYFLTEFYLDVDLNAELVSIDSLMPHSSYVGKDQIDDIVILRTAPLAQDDVVAIESISDKQAISTLETIGYYEWNNQLDEYFRAFEALFGSSHKREELEGLVADENTILSSLLDSIDVFVAGVPRNEEWAKSGLSDEIVDTFTAITESEVLARH